MSRPDRDAPAHIVAACRARGLTVAMGESLTGGLLCSSLADVPGASAVLRGAVVAYHADIKASVLGVTPEALAGGIVSRGVAEQLATGAARVLGADLGVGTTGVAGPEPHDGQPVGSVWISASGPGGVRSRHLALTGDRQGIRRQTVEACWVLLDEMLSSRDLVERRE